VNGDFTKNKLHTLSDQTVKVLKGLKSDVKLRYFVAPAQQQEFDSVLDKYTAVSPKVKKEYVDLDKDPFIVQKYNIKQSGTIIIESESRTGRVENLAGPEDPKIEEKITNAIISVAKGNKKKIYFSTGHGERLLSDTGRDGYSEIKEALENSRYKTEELLLVDKDKIPADAEIIVIAGPKSDFMDHELKLLEAYVKSGGKLLVELDPNSTATMKPFLDKFGVDWHTKKIVLETNRLQQLAGGNPFTPIVTNYNTAQEITQEAKQMSIFPMASPIEKTAVVPTGEKVENLFSTSNRSLEVEFQGDKVKVNEKTDRKGPISLALAVTGPVEGAKPEIKPGDKAPPPTAPPAEEKKKGEFRMIVVGDSDFATNSVRKFGINADLFQNMMSWLAHEEDLISIRPKPTDSSEFQITEERTRVINFASIVFAPFSCFLAGIAVWINRRRK
jgi:ABC-type uncharacterized transport system involved in gliding motility auxiliary subunit